MKHLMLLTLLVLVPVSLMAAPPIPLKITYQGRLMDTGGNPVTDTVSMEFSFHTAETGGTQIWTETQSVVVNQGIFDVLLGDVAELEPFFDQILWLAISVNGTPLPGRVELGTVPYAFVALDVPDNAITGPKIANNNVVRSLNGLDDDVNLVGGANVTVTAAGDSITIDATGGGGADSDWQVNGSDMHTIPTGEVSIGVNSNPGGEKLYVTEASGLPTVVKVADGVVSSVQIAGGTSAGFLTVSNAQGMELSATGTNDDLTLSPVGDLVLTGDRIDFETAGIKRAEINPTGDLDVFESNGGRVGSLGANGTDAGVLQLFHDNNNQTLSLSGSSGGGGEGGGRATLRSVSGGTRIEIEAEENGAPADGAQISMMNAAGTTTVEIDADLGTTNGGNLNLFNSGGVATIEMRGQENSTTTNGAAIYLKDDLGNTTIEFDADWGGTGEGRIITEVIEITGGADLSEQFDINGNTIEPGMVVSIDPGKPGELSVSRTAHDRRVAGVVSGAGGVRPGMLMGQRGTEADGQHPVALTGRVYCRVDASYGSIAPGDLLTTSDTPGYAMKVTDGSKAQGAILGKAMTALDSGQGMVLILVTLQ